VDRGLQRAFCCCLAVVAIALAGCGSSSKSDAGSTTTAQPPPPPKNVVDATQGRLGRALLTKEAAGPAWTIARSRAVAPTQLYCNRQFAGGLQPYARAQTAFKQRYGSAITQDLSAYADDGAKRVIDDFRTIVNSCPTWSSSPEPGRTVKYSLKPLAFAKLGDETVAGRLHTANEFGGIDVEHSVIVAMIRRGNVIDLVTQSANAGLFQPKSQTEALARKADRLLARSG
jgi:hypothetical protein